MAQLLFFHGTGRVSQEDEALVREVLQPRMLARAILSTYELQFIRWVDEAVDPPWSSLSVSPSLPPRYQGEYLAQASRGLMNDGTEDWTQLASELESGDAVGAFVWQNAVTELGKRHRVKIMNGFSAFVQSIVLYMREAEAVQKSITNAIRAVAADEDIVVVGHSLGGMAAVDVLSNPTTYDLLDGRKVKLLVTVGSQAPWVYYLRGLSSLRPENPAVRPFSPWLNIYDENDLLSFCAAGVFADAVDVVDEPIEQGMPFPAAHTNYFQFDGVYDLIEKKLQHLA